MADAFSYELAKSIFSQLDLDVTCVVHNTIILGNISMYCHYTSTYDIIGFVNWFEHIKSLNLPYKVDFTQTSYYKSLTNIIERFDNFIKKLKEYNINPLIVYWAYLDGIWTADVNDLITFNELSYLEDIKYDHKRLINNVDEYRIALAEFTS